MVNGYLVCLLLPGEWGSAGGTNVSDGVGRAGASRWLALTYFRAELTTLLMARGFLLGSSGSACERDTAITAPNRVKISASLSSE